MTTTGGPLSVLATTEGRFAFDLAGFAPAYLDDAATADPDDPNTSATDEAADDRADDATRLAALRTVFDTSGELLARISTVSSSWKYTTADGLQTIAEGDLVKVAKGYTGGTGAEGAIYRYVGTAGPVNLGAQNYLDTLNWKPFELLPRLSVLSKGSQWVLVAPDGATYVLTYDAVGNVVKVSHSTINVVAAAASVALSGGLVGVGVSGAGAVAQNVVLSKTNAYIDSSTVTTQGDLTIRATGTSAITATIAAVSLAIGGGLVGGGLAIGVAVARNFIGWRLDGSSSPAEVRATIRNSAITAHGHLIMILEQRLASWRVLKDSISIVSA